MKMWFCEGCGKRLTEIDLQNGGAKDKQLKGVYCNNCEECVQTQSFDALTLASDEKDVPPAARRTPSRIGAAVAPRTMQASTSGAKLRAAARSSPHSSHEKEHPRRFKVSKSLGIVAMAIGALALGLAIYTSVGAESTHETEKKTQNERLAVITAPPPLKLLAPETKVPAPIERIIAANPVMAPVVHKHPDADGGAPAPNPIGAGYTPLWSFQSTEGWEVWWTETGARPYTSSFTRDGFNVTIDAGSKELSLPIFSALLKAHKPVAEIPDAVSVGLSLSDGDKAGVELYLVDSQKEVFQYARKTLVHGENNIEWKMNNDLTALGGGKVSRKMCGPVFLWELRLIPAGESAVSATFHSVSVVDSKRIPAEPAAPAKPLWTFGPTETWDAWWPEERGRRPFRIEPKTDGVLVTIDPQERELHFPILDGRFRKEVSLGAPQSITLEVNLNQGKSTAIALNVIDAQKEGFELQRQELKPGSNSLTWNFKRDSVRTWGDNQNGKIDYPINLWDIQITCPASKEPIQFLLKAATKVE